MSLKLQKIQKPLECQLVNKATVNLVLQTELHFSPLDAEIGFKSVSMM